MAAGRARVPVFQVVWSAWRDALRAIRAMPAVTGCAVGLYALISIGVFLAVETIVMNPGRSFSQWISSPAWFVFGLFNTSAQIVLLAPFAIAVHRFVILGEAATSYPLRPLRPSYLHYVGIALVLNFAYRAPDLMGLLLPHGLPYIADLAIAAATFALMLSVVIAALRKIALFPAIATHAPRASWRETVPASAGNVLRIAVVVAGVALPAVVMLSLLHLYMPAPNWPNHTGQLVVSFSMVLVQVPPLAAMAAAIARIHLALAADEAQPLPTGRVEPVPA